MKIIIKPNVISNEEKKRACGKFIRNRKRIPC
nr:MAG TPA: hypothetical protein [Caudoviricetes sp.]